MPLVFTVLAFYFCMCVWHECFFVPAKQVLTKTPNDLNVCSEHIPVLKIWLVLVASLKSAGLFFLLSLQNSFLHEHLQRHKEKGIYNFLRIWKIWNLLVYPATWALMRCNTRSKTKHFASEGHNYKMGQFSQKAKPHLSAWPCSNGRIFLFQLSLMKNKIQYQ